MTDAHIHPLESWVDKAGLAHHLSCSTRWVEIQMARGMPHAVIAGRAKFRVSEVTPWLLSSGELELRGQREAA